ncbi:MAG: hypothetical protein J7L95_04515 [Prolixibacteraceae bacterium]|nr:hypothetical protein [Prolixibacteraceae bacterium]
MPNTKINIELHQFIVMPNHIHGIFEIMDGGNGVGCRRDDACIVSTPVATNPIKFSQNDKGVREL